MEGSWGKHFLARLQLCSLTDVVVTDVGRGLHVTYATLLVFVERFRHSRDAATAATSSSTSDRKRQREDLFPLTALVCNDGILLALAEMACLLLAVPFLPQNPKDPAERRLQMQVTFGVEVVFSEQQLEELLQESLKLEEEAVVSRGKHLVGWVSSLVSVSASDKDVAYVITTSGSTGQPKGVVAERGNLRAYVEGFVCTTAASSLQTVCVDHDSVECAALSGRFGLQVSSSSRVLLLSSCTFDPSIGDIGTALHCGALLLCAPRDWIEGGRLLEVLHRANPTHVVTTPALWHTLGDVEPDTLWPNAGSCKVCLGGEPMPLAVATAWAPCVQLYNTYGVTESTIYQSLQRVFPTGSAAAQFVSEHLVGRGSCPPAGQTTGSCKMFVMEIQEGNDDSQATHGEVIVTGPQVCRYYTASADSGSSLPFFRLPNGDRAYRTGDVGAVLEHTHRCSAGGVVEACTTLLISGRLDFQVKLNGQRVALEECERTLLESTAPILTAVCCVVVEVKDGTGTVLRKDLCAACALSTTSYGVDTRGRKLWERALRLHLESLLPAYMVPSQWLFLRHALPTTSTGKTDRRAIRVMFEEIVSCRTQDPPEEVSEASSWREQLSPLGMVVLHEWERLFLVPLKRTSHFFRMGGDSLSALKMVRAVYLRWNGGLADGIDRYGNMPPKFSPRHLAVYPVLEQYISFLEQNADMSASTVAGVGHTESLSDSDGEDDPEGVAAEGHDASSKNPGATLLLEAVDARDEFLVDFLLSKRISPVDGAHCRTVKCPTPLHVAVADGNAALVQLLLRHGAKVTAVNVDGVTPAHLAVMRSTADVLDILLTNGFPVNARDSRQQSLLHVAARFGSCACVEYLLFTHGLNPDIRDCWQRTAAHWAVLNSHIEVVRLLASPRINRDAFKHQARRGGQSTRERSARLARRRTHLVYETAEELAVRLYGGESDMAKVAASLPND